MSDDTTPSSSRSPGVPAGMPDGSPGSAGPGPGPHVVPIDSVRGGSHGITAQYAQMHALAAAFEREGEDLLRRAGLGAEVMADPDLLESALLSPVTFAQAEEAVLSATTGPDGLTVRAALLETDAFLLRSVVETYQAVDELQHAAYEALDYGVGFAIGADALPLAAVGAGLSVVLSPEQEKQLADEVNAWGQDHPGALEHLLNGGGGLVDGLQAETALLLGPGASRSLWGSLGFLPFHPDTESAARDIAALYDDGEPVLHGAPPVTDFRGNQPPASVEDLMQGLQVTNADGTEGYIRIQTITVDGQQRYIAYLPGTDDMGTMPGGSDDTIRDMGANLRLMGGDDTAYGRGVVEALNRATHGDPDAHVMLVGHSQGGMTAAQIAAMGKDSGAHFTIDHVVTAGSPNSQVASLPSHTDMLSLENRGDAVPLTDGEPNPDQPNRTTVRFDSNTGSIAFNHDMSNYVNGGLSIDKAAAGDHGSLQDAVDNLRDYFGGTQVRTDAVVITREVR